MPRNADKRRCAAVTRDGRPCPNWARRGGTLCSAHDVGDEAGLRRCQAVTAKGERCRNRAMGTATEDEAATGALCNVHAGRTVPRTGDRRRCTARRKDGQRCRRWAVRAGANGGYGEVPLCSAHGGGMLPAKGEGRRCRARTKAGKRCRNWTTTATRAGSRGLCSAHAGRFRLPAGTERRCEAITKTGAQCRNWAMRPAEDGGISERALCRVHGVGVRWRAPEARDDEAGRRCTATTLAGARCQNWALAHTAPPLCRVHAYPDAHGQLRHGYYRRTPYLPPQVESALARLAVEGEPLAAEIVVARLKIAALLAYMNQPDLPAGAWLPACRIMPRALRVVARLVRAQQALKGEEFR
jgi:hypothetical protein